MGQLKPRILITRPIKRARIGSFFLKSAVRRSGGMPQIATIRNTPSLDDVDGLILSGGTDIFPDLYGAEIDKSMLYDHERDRMELEYFREAMSKKKPILGICRGMQLINVALEGTLHTELALAFEEAEHPFSLWSKAFYRKKVLLDKQTLIHEICGRDFISVNSLHHQGIHELGKKLKITARERNNVPQAIERIQRESFLLGVQWHPEFMPFSGVQKQIFDRFVAECQA